MRRVSSYAPLELLRPVLLDGLGKDHNCGLLRAEYRVDEREERDGLQRLAGAHLVGELRVQAVSASANDRRTSGSKWRGRQRTMAPWVANMYRP